MSEEMVVKGCGDCYSECCGRRLDNICKASNGVRRRTVFMTRNDLARRRKELAIPRMGGFVRIN